MDNPALKELIESLKEGDSSKASSSLRTLLNQDIDIKTILENGVLKAVLEIGEAICSVPEFSEEEKEAMKKWTQSLMTLYRLSMEIDANIKVPDPPIGKAIVACVTGEGHIMVKEVLAPLFKVNGFNVYNFRQPASPDMIVKKIKEMDANLLVISAEYTVTIPTIKKIIESLKKEGLREKVKIIMGGGLLNKDLKGLDKEIDLLGNDVLKSVEEAKSLIK